MSDYEITELRDSDYTQWSTLFKAYVDFYKSTLPQEQYQKTFNRLLDPSSELYGLVLRDSQDSAKIIGLAHYFPHQTPWNEKMIMHLNDLFVDPDVRARGYGRALIKAVEEKAREMGCFRLEWATQHGNEGARRLYDQLATCEFVEYRIELK